MTALLIIACSATKRHDAGGLPALNRYDGPAFRVLRKALRERAGLEAALTIRILSARYGMIESYVPIEDYDRQMTQARALEMEPRVLAVRRQLQARPWASVHISLGRVYWEAFGLPWPGASVAHGGIGERLGQLKAWLWEVEL